ncbi:MAG: hypothetical protein ABI162_03185 [Luteolibacter sp.]
MMENRQSAGRFLPSQVYRRWKWSVRFGLLIVPMLFLLSEGPVLFLTPSKYGSTVLLEIENGRTPQENAKLLQSSQIIESVVRGLGLSQRWNVDTDTAEIILRENTEVKVVPDSRLIEISVTSVKKDLARDIAKAIPQNLSKLEGDRLLRENSSKIAKMDRLIDEASDASAVKAVAITKIEKLHGPESSDSAVLRELERARRASLVADAEVERLEVLRAEITKGSINLEPRLIIHTEPQISDKPTNPKWGAALDELLLQALAVGLVTALFLPYLWELAFPWQKGYQIHGNLIQDV